MKNGTRPGNTQVRRAAFLPSTQESDFMHTLKRNLFYLALVCAIPLAAYGAGSTEKPQSLTDGLHVTGKTTDRWSFGTTTPAAQSATTKTAWQALEDHGVIASGGDYSIQHKSFTLTAANLIAMYTTPVEIIAAQGAGKSIVVQKLTFSITRTSTAFTGGGAVIFQYAATANGAGTQALDSTIAAAVVTGAAGVSKSFRNGAVISDSANTVTENVGLFISNATAVFAAGTGTVTGEVWYYVNEGA